MKIRVQYRLSRKNKDNKIRYLTTRYLDLSTHKRNFIHYNNWYNAGDDEGNHPIPIGEYHISESEEPTTGSLYWMYGGGQNDQ